MPESNQIIYNRTQQLYQDNYEKSLESFSHTRKSWFYGLSVNKDGVLIKRFRLFAWFDSFKSNWKSQLNIATREFIHLAVDKEISSREDVKGKIRVLAKEAGIIQHKRDIDTVLNEFQTSKIPSVLKEPPQPETPLAPKEPQTPKVPKLILEFQENQSNEETIKAYAKQLHAYFSQIAPYRIIPGRIPQIEFQPTNKEQFQRGKDILEKELNIEFPESSSLILKLNGGLSFALAGFKDGQDKELWDSRYFSAMNSLATPGKVLTEKTTQTALIPALTPLEAYERCKTVSKNFQIEKSPSGHYQIHFSFPNEEERLKAIHSHFKGEKFDPLWQTADPLQLKLSNSQTFSFLGYSKANKIQCDRILDCLTPLKQLEEHKAVQTLPQALERFSAIARFTVVPSPLGHPQVQFTFDSVQQRDHAVKKLQEILTAFFIKDPLSDKESAWQRLENSPVLTLSSNESFALLGFTRDHTLHQKLFQGMMPLLNPLFEIENAEQQMTLTLPKVSNVYETKERLLALGGAYEVIKANHSYQVKFNYISPNVCQEQLAFLRSILSSKHIEAPLADPSLQTETSLTLSPEESLALLGLSHLENKTFNSIMQTLYGEMHAVEPSTLLEKTGNWAKYYTDNKVPMKTFLISLGCELTGSKTLPGKNFLKNDTYHIEIPSSKDFFNDHPVTLKISKQKIIGIQKSAKVMVSKELGVEGYKALLKLVDEQAIANVRSIVIPEHSELPIPGYTAEMYTCLVCHSVRLPALTQPLNHNRLAVQQLASIDLDEASEIILISTPGANFAYGDGFREIFLDDKGNLKVESFERFLSHLWSNVVESAIQQEATDLSLLPIGMGEFLKYLLPSTTEAIKKAYLKSLNSVLQDPKIHAHFKNGIFFSLGPISMEMAQEAFKDSKCPVHLHTKDAFNLMQLISLEPGRTCAGLNPSDGDVMVGIRNPGQFWQDSTKGTARHVGEEFVMHIIPGQLAGRDMCPEAFSNPILCSLNPTEIGE